VVLPVHLTTPLRQRPNPAPRRDRKRHLLMRMPPLPSPWSALPSPPAKAEYLDPHLSATVGCPAARALTAVCRVNLGIEVSLGGFRRVASSWCGRQCQEEEVAVLAAGPGHFHYFLCHRNPHHPARMWGSAIPSLAAAPNSSMPKKSQPAYQFLAAVFLVHLAA